MKGTIQLMSVLVLLVLSKTGMAQNMSNKGTDFWVGYGHHQFMETGQTNSQEMAIYVSAEEPATVTITIDSATNSSGVKWSKTYNIPANTVIVCDSLPKNGAYDARLFSVPISFGGNGGEGLFRKKGIHIESNVPVVAYAHIYGSASSGASMLMPTNTWGYAYTSINSAQQYATNTFSWFYVVAQRDSTMVEINPSVPSVLYKATNGQRGHAPNVPFKVMLMKGQIYQFTAAIESGSTGYNATGSTIRSIANPHGKCYPIAVFSGSSRTTNPGPSPGSCGTGGGDNDNQQLFPTQAWGKRYLTAPLSGSASASSRMVNYFKVVVKDPGTVVKKDGAVLTGLLPGNYYYFSTNEPSVIEADKPIMVAQYMSGGSTCLAGGVGDPEMIIISPIEQGIKKIGFYRNKKEGITVNYLTMIIPTGGLTSLKIDGSSSFDHTYAHPKAPGFSVVVKRWPSLEKQALASSDSAFTAVTYGLGSVESYGYNAGTMVNNLNLIPSVQNELDTTRVEHTFTCVNTPVKIGARMGFKPTRMVWQLSNLAGVLSPAQDVTVNNPQPDDSVLVNGVSYYRYELPATYYFNTGGQHEVSVLATHPSIESCNNTEEIKFKIDVRDNPFADFTLAHNGCTLDTAAFTANTNTGTSFTIASYLWEFPNNATGEGQTVKRVLPPGSHPVKLSLITTEGCLGDTTKTVNVFAKPVTSFGTNPANMCEGTSVVFTDTTTYGGPTAVTSWYWDFGTGTPVTVTNGGTQTITYPTYGEYRVKHLVKVSDLCVSDTMFTTVNVYAKPRLSFDYPKGCLPADGVVQFNSSATNVPDGSAIASYSWNFGDANATPSNPNTSTIANPSHIYTQYGNYTISFSVTTDKGCSKDSLVQAVFNVRPQLAFAALSSVCENAAAFSVARGSVTNGVLPSKQYYRGPGTDSLGNFKPSVAGAGTHTIWYIFTSQGGCSDSLSREISVFAQPRPDFSYPEGGCISTTGLVQFDGTLSTIADTQVVRYSWNFGDPNASASNPNTSTAQSPSHNYGEGIYTIALTAATAQGCVAVKDTVATFSLKPLLTYAALPTVCENTASVSVATAAVTNNVQRKNAYYRGTATNAAGNFNPSVAGPGTFTIWYVFETMGGCKDSVSSEIKVVAAPKPDFSYPDGGCISTTGLVQFDGSLTTISDGQALNYEWNFGDANATPSNPNTSSVQNPSHVFNDGTYTITLKVSTPNGCVAIKDSITTFSLKPVLNYPALASVCESVTGTVSVATATVTNGVQKRSELYKGTATDASGKFNPSQAGPGTFEIWYYFTSTGGCIDSISQSITVYAKPVVNFTPPAENCLPDPGIAQFTGTATLPSGQAQTISTYSWDFDDPNASPSNPNTASGQTVSHRFTDFGTYDVKFSATSSRGCVGEKTIPVTLGVKPVLSYPYLTSVCESAGPVAINTGIITNGVTARNTTYSGRGVSGNNFNPAVAGPGSHRITYMVTSTGGCIDSAHSVIKVHPKPTAAFNVTAAVCVGESVTIDDNSTVATGRLKEWRWDMGDGTNPVVSSSGASFTHTYAGYKNYTIALVAVSDSNCVSDAHTKPVMVHPLPLVDFDLPGAICMPNGVANFRNRSTLPGNGTLHYEWDFDDNSLASSENSPSHVYTSNGPFDVKLTATSAFGCSAERVKVLDAFFEKPEADFNVSDATICQGTPSTFTDNSRLDPNNSPIRSYNWTFGDNTTSQAKNPSKTYSRAGKYEVTLTVTNEAGCVSVPYRDSVLVLLQPQIELSPAYLVVPLGQAAPYRLTVNDSSSLRFRWDPASDFTNPNEMRPVIIATTNKTYTLTAIGDGGCTDEDEIEIRVLNPVNVPNAFSPNGDNVNDVWIIKNLIDYPGATVEIFNRYGQQVYFSVNYTRPWDGSVNGRPLPMSTYYYVINLKNGFQPITGSVTIVR